jgi:hypothetical protein
VVAAIFDLQAYIVEKLRTPESLDITPDRFHAIWIARTRRNSGQQSFGLYTSVSHEFNALDEVPGLGVLLRVLRSGAWTERREKHTLATSLNKLGKTSRRAAIARVKIHSPAGTVLLHFRGGYKRFSHRTAPNS